MNPNSPLVWDGLMVETLVACAEFGQPVAITPFLLAGASAPVTLAGGLSLLVAETLAGVAMAQLVRPGCTVHPRLLLQRRRHAFGWALARTARVGAHDVCRRAAGSPLRVAAARRRWALRGHGAGCADRYREHDVDVGDVYGRSATWSCMRPGGWRAD